MESVYDSADIIDQEKLALIQKMFFEGQPVSTQVELQGYVIGEDGNYCLGCQSGPRIHVSNLIHEMCHLAEREVDKLLKKPYNAWGYSFVQYWELLGRSGYESQNAKTVHREKRVWAFQLSVEKELGIRDIEDADDPEESHAYSLVKSAIYLDAFMWYKREVLTENQLEDYSKGEQQAIQILSEEVDRLSEKDFTYARFCDDWFHRMELLK